MVIRVLVLVTFLLEFSDSRRPTRSVTLEVKHRQEFGTRDIEDRNFIQIPDYHEDVLNFQRDTQYSPKQLDSVKEKGNENKNIIELFKQGANRKSDKITSKTNIDTVRLKGINDEPEIDVDRYFGEEYTIFDESLDDKNSAIDNNKIETNENDKNEILHIRDSVVNINKEECNIEKISCLHKLYGSIKRQSNIMGVRLEKSPDIKRHKRAAQEQWRNSLPGSKKEVPEETEFVEPDEWKEVTDADLEKARLNTYTQIMEYAGWTALSAVVFIFIGICFIRDPIACIFAFGTGCPCCLICCPCIRSFTDKYLDTKRLVREQMNKYMPGIIVNDDGSLDFYEPTPDEMDILMEIIDEMQG